MVSCVWFVAPFFQDLYQVQNDQVKVQEGNELHSKYSHAFFSGILFWFIQEKLGELYILLWDSVDNESYSRPCM